MWSHLPVAGHGLDRGGGAEAKVFWFFSSEKNMLACLRVCSAGRIQYRARMSDIEVVVLDRRLHDWGLPRYHSEMAAAIDLHACLDEDVSLEAGAPARLIPAGIAVHMGDAHMAALIVPRSGLGHKKGLVVGNLVGVIDADYLGPVMVSAWNRNAAGGAAISISPGERIAQMLFVPILRPGFRVVEAFSRSTVRGEGGFGSTG
jgi:dUTP pyrophosphatase